MLWSPALGVAGHEGHWNHIHTCSSTCAHGKGRGLVLDPGQVLCFSWEMAGRSLRGDSCFFRGVAAFPHTSKMHLDNTGPSAQSWEMHEPSGLQ